MLKLILGMFCEPRPWTWSKHNGQSGLREQLLFVKNNSLFQLIRFYLRARLTQLHGRCQRGGDMHVSGNFTQPFSCQLSNCIDACLETGTQGREKPKLWTQFREHFLRTLEPVEVTKSEGSFWLECCAFHSEVSYSHTFPTLTNSLENTSAGQWTCTECASFLSRAIREFYFLF